MKRAVLLVIATATLLLLGLPSAPLHAESGNSTVYDSPSVVTQGTAIVGGPITGAGGGGGGGGTDQGDADGLSGIKNRIPTGNGVAGPGLESQSLIRNLWWKFMILWMR